MAIAVASPKQKKDSFGAAMNTMSALDSVQKIQAGQAQGPDEEKPSSQKAAMDRRLEKKDKMIYGEF